MAHAQSEREVEVALLLVDGYLAHVQSVVIGLNANGIGEVAGEDAGGHVVELPCRLR